MFMLFSGTWRTLESSSQVLLTKEEAPGGEDSAGHQGAPQLDSTALALSAQKAQRALGTAQGGDEASSPGPTWLGSENGGEARKDGLGWPTSRLGPFRIPSIHPIIRVGVAAASAAR